MGKQRQHDISPTIEPPLCLPVEELLEHEVQSLEKLARVGGWPHTLFGWQRLIYASSQTAKRNGALDIHLGFKASDPHGTREQHVIDLGAKIDARGPGLVTYFLSLGEDSTGEGRRGLRKFHFDVDHGPSVAEPKPAIHLQMPGRMWPALVEAGYAENAFDHLEPHLDKPRIVSLPTSIAILAHSVLMEYVASDPSIATFVRSSAWQTAVSAAERAIVLSFMKHCVRWMKKSVNENRSLISYLYRYGA